MSFAFVSASIKCRQNVLISIQYHVLRVMEMLFFLGVGYVGVWDGDYGTGDFRQFPPLYERLNTI